MLFFCTGLFLFNLVICFARLCLAFTKCRLMLIGSFSLIQCIRKRNGTLNLVITRFCRLYNSKGGFVPRCQSFAKKVRYVPAFEFV